ncbi:hypothetical protein BH09ACT7_BH09ACT7_06230 [soil metagenome]
MSLTSPKSRIPGPREPGNSPGVLQSPLLRNGHLLTLSSALVAVMGLCFWTTAAWKYDASAVGSNSAAISMMMLLVSISQLNLSSAVARFVPAAGHHTKVLVAAAFAIGGCAAIVVGVCTVMIVRIVSPGSTFFEGSTVQAIFVIATVASTVLIIEEGVLAGLRRTALVPLANFAFSAGKLGLVLAFAVTIPSHGILASWSLAAVSTVLVVGVYLFVRAIPSRRRAGAIDAVTLPPIGELARFVTLDYLGAICSVASLTVMPILVVTVLGAEQNAYFSMAWLVAASIFQINLNMGTSLVVESSIDQSDLARQARHVLTHTGKVLAVVVLAILVLAPYVLGVFGKSYQVADDTLRIFALAALPHLVVMTGISSARAQRRMWLVVWAQVPQCVLALPLTWLLLPVIGMAGASVAWLITVSLIAVGLLIRKDLWLTVAAAPVNTNPTEQKAQL